MQAGQESWQAREPQRVFTGLVWARALWQPHALCEQQEAADQTLLTELLKSLPQCYACICPTRLCRCVLLSFAEPAGPRAWVELFARLP